MGDEVERAPSGSAPTLTIKIQLKGKNGVGTTEKAHFSRCLNISRDSEEVMCEGKLFPIHAPVTGKARRPTIERLETGTDRLLVVEDRSLCRDDM